MFDACAIPTDSTLVGTQAKAQYVADTVKELESRQNSMPNTVIHCPD